MEVLVSELCWRHRDREALCRAAVKVSGEVTVNRTGTLTCFIVDQLQNERSAGNNAGSTWKKVPVRERRTHNRERKMSTRIVGNEKVEKKCSQKRVKQGIEDRQKERQEEEERERI